MGSGSGCSVSLSTDLRQDLRLLEVDEGFLSDICRSGAVFKGPVDGIATLCTETRTYSLKSVETTNSLLLLNDTEVLRTHGGGAELKVCAMAGAHLEVAQARPRLTNLDAVMQATLYTGEEPLAPSMRSGRAVAGEAVSLLQQDGIDARLVRHCLACFGSPVGAAGVDVWALEPGKVCQQLAVQLLQEQGTWPLTAFMQRWCEAAPEGMEPSVDMLRGVALVDGDNLVHFPVSVLPSGAADRDSFAGGRGAGRGGGGMSGGGEAGGGKRDSNLTYIRQVPKFLQSHAHLLGKKGGDEPALAELASKRPRDSNDSEDDGDDDKEALQRAVAENPSLGQQYPELASVVAKGEAAAEKERGNAAFAAKRYEDAAASFTKCIALHPTNEVYFSNRAAALTLLRRHAEALADGKRAVALKPQWAKGWARVAAAHAGLAEHEEAREAYERALELEPDDQALQEARHKADVAARKAAEERRHRFKRPHERAAARGIEAKSQRTTPGHRAAAVKLSFYDDDGG
ncbi:hypothetical protein WJX81_003977 [Elliptochloris bilobata]|uniref:Uncharacterized protein n=1 Tax=Elliptochloris bilobata TaxID=381761 RepID=A0AAW1R1G3_9CHLO